MKISDSVPKPDDESRRSAPRPDRVLRWPLIGGCSVPILLMVMRAFPQNSLFAFLYMLFGISALVLVWDVAASGAIIVAGIALRRRAWRRTVSAALFPAIVLAANWQSQNFLRFCYTVGDVVSFQFVRSFYLEEVRAKPIVDGQRIATFVWGGSLWSTNGVVYDESDEVASPPGTQSAAWRAQAYHTLLSCGDYGYWVWPAGGHFYIAYYSC